MPCYVSQVHLVFLGKISIIRTYFYALFIDFMCIFMYDILHELGISLPHEAGFNKVKNAYIKSVYYSICDDYDVDTNETCMHGEWFYATDMPFLVMK